MFAAQEGSVFSCQTGSIAHSAVLAEGAGGTIATQSGDVFSIHKPTLEQYVLNMRREATPTYPKDASAICMLLDLAPGQSVLEAGSGSGGLTLFLSRAVGPSGKVVSVEAKNRHQQQARVNVESFQALDNIDWRLGELNEFQFNDGEFGAIALDMMEPWLVLEGIVASLRLDGSLVCYLPNITQVVFLLEFIAENKLPLAQVRTVEASLRTWDVRPPVAHPSFQQIGHTAFLVQLIKMKR